MYSTDVPPEDPPSAPPVAAPPVVSGENYARSAVEESWGTVNHTAVSDNQGNRIFQLGDVLEDSNGYCLLVTGINAESGTFVARDFPEQVFEPVVRVTREIRIIPNLADFFVIRLPTPDEVRRIQRAGGAVEDGVMGPRTIAGFTPPEILEGSLRVSLLEPAPEPVAEPGHEAPTRFDRVNDE